MVTIQQPDNLLLKTPKIRIGDAGPCYEWIRKAGLSIGLRGEVACYKSWSPRKASQKS